MKALLHKSGKFIDSKGRKTANEAKAFIGSPAAITALMSSVVGLVDSADLKVIAAPAAAITAFQIKADKVSAAKAQAKAKAAKAKAKAKAAAAKAKAAEKAAKAKAKAAAKKATIVRLPLT